MSTLNRESANDVVAASSSFANAIRGLATMEMETHSINSALAEQAKQAREAGDVFSKQATVTVRLARAIFKQTDHVPGDPRPRKALEPLKSAWFAALTPQGSEKPISAARKSWDSAWQLLDSESFAALREGSTVKAFEAAAAKILDAKGNPVASRSGIGAWVKAQRAESVRLAEWADNALTAYRAQTDGTLPDPADMAALLADACERAAADAANA